VGDKVTVKWSKIYNKEHKEILDIIYEDNELLAINKPTGLLSISTDKEKERTAYHMVMDYVRHNNPRNRIFVVHRLDRDTSGVLLFAKNDTIKRQLQNSWDYLVSIRGYIAIVEGKPEEQVGTIKSWLKETSSLLVYSTNDKKEGQKAITHYRVMKENDKYTLLDIRIDTGRKNQIRVHMNDIGHSIIGDKKYGAKTNPLKRLGLHAHVLEFKHPVTKKIMHFETPIPNEFMKLFRA
jgi:23S rRNA pseudouridine1911/1915/1917 synthase